MIHVITVGDILQNLTLAICKLKWKAWRKSFNTNRKECSSETEGYGDCSIIDSILKLRDCPREIYPSSAQCHV